MALGKRASESSISRDALGWLALCGGIIWLAVALHIAPVGPPAEDASYLYAVLVRSFGNGLQALILAGLMTVPLHAVWTFGRCGSDAIDGYDKFGLWAQTIFTAMGFMGTIVGVSIAVAGLKQAMVDKDPATLIGGLSTAFDTTFLGLTGAVSLMVLRKVTRFVGGRVD